MTQETFDFMAEAIKTSSPHFHKERVPATLLYRQTKKAIAELDKLDKMRKALFYDNREYEMSNEDKLMATHPDARSYEALQLSSQIVHAIVGAACEGAEKLDLLIRAMDGEEFDLANYIEEVGDGMWFDAVGLSKLGFTIPEVQRAVIRKIRQRTGGLFTKEGFNERDLAAERAILDDAARHSTE